MAASFNVGADPVDFIEGIPNLAIIAEELTEVELKLFDTALSSMLEKIGRAHV